MTRICTRCVLPETFHGITFDESGVCSVCREHQDTWAGWDEGLPAKTRQLERLVADAKAKKRPFDVLVPLSGGKDSMYVLYYAVKHLGLKTMAFSLDNSFLTAHAKENIERGCRILGVEHIYYRLDPHMVNKLFGRFMQKTGTFCSVCMRGIGMATEIVADIYNPPLVFGGSSTRTELPLTDQMFQSGPVEYMRNVLKGEPAEYQFPRLLYQGSWRRRLGYRRFWWGSQKRVRDCAWVNLPDYVEWNYDEVYRVIREELGWYAPPNEEEHTDCAIHPVTTYLHNRRFPGLEIRRLTFAGLIHAGQMTREEALRKLEEPEEECDPALLEGFLERLGMSREEFDRHVDAGPRHLGFRPQPSAAWQLARKIKRAVFSTLGLRK